MSLTQDLIGRVLRHVSMPCGGTAIPRVSLTRVPRTSRGTATILTPVTCLILQGEKRVTIGDAMLTCADASYFVASLDLPATGEVVVTCADRPFVAVGLELDRSMLADLIAAMPPDLIGNDDPQAGARGFGISPVTPDLLAAWASLLALLDQPEDAPLLAPLREREILYRLLRDPLGGCLREIARADSRLARIRRAIDWMRDHYAESPPIAALAEMAGMSVASFHRHFRAATAMSPLQYQKALRLHAARRLLAAGRAASSVGYAVGYGSASQFSREYRRSFGHSPSRDAR